MEQFMETADCAKGRGVVPAVILADVRSGLLPVAATTLRGTRLFRKRDFETYLDLVKERRREREDLRVKQREALKATAAKTAAPPRTRAKSVKTAPVEQAGRSSAA